LLQPQAQLPWVQLQAFFSQLQEEAPQSQVPQQLEAFGFLMFWLFVLDIVVLPFSFQISALDCAFNGADGDGLETLQSVQW
jgi:hypothetical protein